MSILTKLPVSSVSRYLC